MRRSSVITPVCSGLAILAGSFSFIGSAQAVTLLSEDFEGGSNVFGAGSTYNYSQNYTMPNLLVPGGGLTYLTGGAGINGSVSTNIYPATGSPLSLLTGGITGAQIDASLVSYNLYAQFSTYYGQNDNGTLSVQFLDGASSPLGSPVEIGGAAFVSALGGGTGLRDWGADTLTGVVPPGARSASVQIVEVKTSGGTSIDGYMDNVNISLAVGAVPISLATASPTNNASGVNPAVAVSVVLRDGTAPLDNGSVLLSFDGSPVSPSILPKSGTDTPIQYDPPGLLAPFSTHNYKIAFNKDGGATANTTNEYAFAVGAYVDIILPAPIYFENFDATAEGSLPAGWTQTNYTDVTDGALDLTDLNSASYATWLAVDRDRFTNTFLTYLTHVPTDDYLRVLSTNLFNVVNGQVVTNLSQSRLVFGNSGYRSGLSQVLDLFSPDYDLTGKTNVYVSYHSLWEQNQDSIGAVEYSVNQGATWLPIVYLLDSRDVVTNLDGSIDPVTTLTIDYSTNQTVTTDVALYVDPADGQTKGGNYGAFIGVASNQWSTLAPYISARVDDDPVESKRVEIFRLPQADNQPTVRLRFAHAGTDSWYFGVDDVGLYSLPLLKINSIVSSGGNVTVSWDGAAGTKLQRSTSLTSPNWQDVPGSNGASNATESSSSAGAYYRLVRPY